MRACCKELIICFRPRDHICECAYCGKRHKLPIIRNYQTENKRLQMQCEMMGGPYDEHVLLLPLLTDFVVINRCKWIVYETAAWKDGFMELFFIKGYDTIDDLMELFHGVENRLLVCRG